MAFRVPMIVQGLTDTLTVCRDAREVWKADDIDFNGKREDHGRSTIHGILAVTPP